jgi:MerR family mercuric resistance operon transcriptional regulator
MQGEFIGKASRDTGLGIDTIRFYEKVGLIEHPARTSGEFRIFSVSDIHDLRVIRRLVSFGFSLSEMKHVLGLRRKKMDACPTVRELIRRQLVTVRGKIRVLRGLEQELGRSSR